MFICRLFHARSRIHGIHIGNDTLSLLNRITLNALFLLRKFCTCYGLGAALESLSILSGRLSCITVDAAGSHSRGPACNLSVNAA